MSKYGLFKVTNPKGETENPSITELHMFSNEEEKIYSEDQKLINRFVQSKNIFTCYHINVEYFLTQIIDIADKMLNKQVYPFNEKTTSVFGCSFNNILSSYKSILDFFEYSLSKEFSQESSEYAGWKSIQADCFDNSSSYRFMYYLRNYCQHIGLPPFNFKTNQSIERPGSLKLSITLLRDELIKDKSCWKKFFSEVQQRPQYIELLPILDEFNLSIKKLQKYILELQLNFSLESAKRILQYRTDFYVDNLSRINHGFVIRNKDKSVTLKLSDINEINALLIKEYSEGKKI
jgi:hypothetical protein